MSEVKKIEIPQKNTVREFDRWPKEITDATNVNVDFIPDKPSQQEGPWECEEGCGIIESEKVFHDQDKGDYHVYNQFLPDADYHQVVKFIPSPTETPEAWRCPECGSDDWGDGTCNACGYTPWDGDETPEAEKLKRLDVRQILSQTEKIVRDHSWLGLANNLEQIAPELLRAWNRRAGTESTHYYEASKLKNHFVEPTPSPSETPEAEEPVGMAQPKYVLIGIIEYQKSRILEKDKEIERLKGVIEEAAAFANAYRSNAPATTGKIIKILAG